MTNYRAVGNRCAVDLESLKLGISNEEALGILKNKGFEVIELDLIKLARAMVGSRYRRAARLAEAPETFDCSSFTKWLYGQCGIWLPRRSIQQSQCGEEIGLNDLRGGELVFVSGVIDYFEENPLEGIGHVGIATGWSVVHAANSKDGVIESTVNEFIGKDKFRIARRIIPKKKGVITLLTPPEREVECSDDIRWIILQNLKDNRAL